MISKVLRNMHVIYRPNQVGVDATKKFLANLTLGNFHGNFLAVGLRIWAHHEIRSQHTSVFIEDRK